MIAKYQARLTRYEASLEIAYDTFDELMGRNNEEYRIDTEDGTMQKARIQNLNKIQKQIDFLEGRIDWLCRKLSGRGVTNIVLRRHRNAGCW
jgi:hypothetical protein